MLRSVAACYYFVILLLFSIAFTIAITIAITTGNAIMKFYHIAMVLVGGVHRYSFSFKETTISFFLLACRCLMNGT